MPKKWEIKNNSITVMFEQESTEKSRNSFGKIQGYNIKKQL